MSNLVLNAVQIAPAVALVAPVQEKEFNKEEFGTLNFLAENATVFQEILKIFKDTKTISEQTKILKTLSKEKQHQINNFFEKLHNNSSKHLNNSSKSPLLRIRVDAPWYWFGVWNLTFTKSESELIKNILWAGSGGAELAFQLSALVPLPPVVTTVLGVLGIFLGAVAGAMEFSMYKSEYGNFYISFAGIIPVAIKPGWNDGK